MARANLEVRAAVGGAGRFHPICEAVCADAYRAGDAKTLKERYQMRIDNVKLSARGASDEINVRSAKRAIGELMIEHADLSVQLTADRATAASVYKRGWLLKENNGSSNPKSWEEFKYLPSWWPEGANGQRFEPPEKKRGDGEEESETGAEEGENDAGRRDPGGSGS